MKYMAPIIKGVMIAILVSAISIDSFSGDWWKAIIALNVMVNI